MSRLQLWNPILRRLYLNDAMSPEAATLPSLTRAAQSDGSLLLSGGSRVFRITRLKPGAILVTGCGSVRDASDREAQAAVLVELSAEIQRSGELVIFADSRATPRLSSEFALDISRWLRANDRNVSMSHMLLSSKLVEMAIAVGGMANDNYKVKTYRNSEAFITAIRAVVPRFASLPTVQQPR